MNEPIPPELLGGWRLVSLEERETEDAPWDRPLGEGARGVAFFHVGMVSVHIHAPDAPRRELRNVAYFGFFTVRDVERTGETVRGEVLLDLEGGFPVEVLEGDVPRPFEVRADTLVLGDQRTWRTTLERIR